MRKLTQKMMIMSVITLLGASTYAQKSMDLSIDITASPTVINFNDSFKITVKITNNGPVPLTTSDTCGFSLIADKAPLNPFVGPLAVGANLTYMIAGKHTDATLKEDATGQVCYYILPQSAIVRKSDNTPVTHTYNDTLSKNDTSCVTLTLKKKPAVGIFDLPKSEREHLSVYPNPATSVVSFNVNLENTEEISASVKDVAGKEVLSQHFGKLKGKQTMRLDVAKLPPGAYFIEVNTSDKRYLNKLVISNR